MKELLKKYDVPAPRYTSYPTVPYWSDSPTTAEWLDSVNKTLVEPNSSWSMYLHLPFCETLCTFCGCNTTITRDHRREDSYTDMLLKEWSYYLKSCPDLAKKPIKELHLGGGTPTFFSPSNLQNMLKALMENFSLASDFEASIEVDPRRTTSEHLEKLYEIGFRRVSMGVQDFDPEVQRLVNRIQPEKMTWNLTKRSRDLGYTSVNYDLIYGLPKQDLKSMDFLIERTIEHRPDRIALYSFALVPWIKPTHRIFKDEDLPVGAEKRELYEFSREKLLKAGYVEIGMDHFSLKSDSLYQSMLSGDLHRNFMGYTDKRTDLLLGLGVSSISETPEMFHQNDKKLPVYERLVGQGDIPTFRGHKLTKEDLHQRELILKLMTKWEVQLSSEETEDLKDFLSTVVQDGLIEFENQNIKVTEQGRPFIRNICMGLDKRLRNNHPERKVFSQSI